VTEVEKVCPFTIDESYRNDSTSTPLIPRQRGTRKRHNVRKVDCDTVSKGIRPGRARNDEQRGFAKRSKLTFAYA
jgi:hypothetical protein